MPDHLAATGPRDTASHRKGAARAPGAPDAERAAITPAVTRNMVNALQDAVELADGDGTITLANMGLEVMIAYQHGSPAVAPGRWLRGAS